MVSAEASVDPEASESSLESVHTGTLTQLLTQAGISLCITTYQAGKVILARAADGVTNTHFRGFSKPMGLVATADRLVLGAAGQILDFRNVPSAAQKLDPPGSHTGCYMPRVAYTTGDIDVHEMALVDNEILFVNTRFSCLCRINTDFSFEPIWKPDFISAYDPRDRCHLNGLAVRDGKVRYVSALGKSDEPRGWRKDKANGGIIIDLLDNSIVRSGLSMPHSPRWYANAFWYLESGKGEVVACNLNEDKDLLRVKLPGFTRGLDFWGDYAFVGTSQVRETAVFSDLEITRDTPVRESGVWVINIRSGAIEAFLKFTGGVREIFAVSVLNQRFPDIGSEDTTLQLGTFVVPNETLAEAVSPNPDWKSADDLFEAGNQLFNGGDISSAVDRYREALELDTGFLPARYNLGLALNKLGESHEARQTLLSVVEREAGHYEALYQLGALAEADNDADLARSYFERALAVRPKFEAAREALSRLKR